MNFFFGLKHKIFNCEIQIPKFQNKNLNNKKLKLFKCFPRKNQWCYEHILSKEIENDFFIINQKDLNNTDLFFLSEQNDESKFDSKKLQSYNNYTNTSPAFRSNLKLFINGGGFSSYQAEYPSRMLGKSGTIFSSIHSLTNKDAEENFIIFRNVCEDPIEEDFKAYFLDYKKKVIEKEIILKTNNTNIININKDLIKPEMFFVSKKYLGIPMYLSLKENHLSFEHTHPPHSYIYSENKFEIIKNIKNEINEIIN